METTDNTNTEEKGYILLGENYPSYDLSFKLIVIGDSGMKYIYNFY